MSIIDEAKRVDAPALMVVFDASNMVLSMSLSVSSKSSCGEDELEGEHVGSRG